jgi:transposase
LGKTDKIDAQVLAHFAEALRPDPRPLPDQEQQLLKAALQRRLQVVKMISQEKAAWKSPSSLPSARISKPTSPGCINA